MIVTNVKTWFSCVGNFGGQLAHIWGHWRALFKPFFVGPLPAYLARWSLNNEHIDILLKLVIVSKGRWIQEIWSWGEILCYVPQSIDKFDNNNLRLWKPLIPNRISWLLFSSYYPFNFKYPFKQKKSPQSYFLGDFLASVHLIYLSAIFLLCLM